MAPLLLDVAIRSTLIALAAAAILRGLRIKTAATQHLAWATVLVAMLVLPLWSVVGPQLQLRLLPPVATSASAPSLSVTPAAPLSAAVEPLDLAVADATPTSTTARTIAWQDMALAVYGFGVTTLLLRLIIGTVHANRLRRSAIAERGLATTERCATPITIGWFEPTMILPSGWQRWPSSQLAAVLTHEKEHVRRRDPLVQWIALLNRAVFWFHPLSWWLERKLATLAEEACDAAVLAAGHSPQDYSNYLLDIARSMSRDGRRVNVVGMAMPGSGLKPRLRKILDGRPLQRASGVRTAAVVAICAMSSVLLVAGTLTPRSATQTVQAAVEPPAATPAFGPRPSPAKTQQPAAPAKTVSALFEVVSIKPCGQERPNAGVASAPSPGARGGGAGGWQAQTTPGHVYWDCVTLASLVDLAYADREHPLLNTTGSAAPPRTDGLGPNKPKRVRGGPSWVESDKFAIEAKVPVELTAPALAGSTGRNLTVLPPGMAAALRAALEDRFQLKVRRVTEQQDMYALVVGEGGFNKDKVTTPVPGDCLTREQYSEWMATAAPPKSIAEAEAGPRICGGLFSSMTGMEYFSATFLQLANHLSTLMDNFVLDRTGIDTKFNFKFKSGAGDTTDQRLLAGVALLGLKLQPVKAPAEYLVIDKAEKPRPNFPAFAPDGVSAGKPMSRIR